MKRRNKAFLTAAALTLALAGTVALAGCSYTHSHINAGVYHYSDAKLYTAGGASLESNQINDISVNWIAGEVIIEKGTGSEITFSETGAGEDSDYFLYYAVKGGELDIEFQKDGTRLKNNFQKTLHITLPETITFRDFEVDSVSASVTVNGVSASDLSIDSVSGDITVTNCAAADISLDSVSGKLDISSSTATELNMETVSGALLIASAEKFSMIDLETVSGNTDLTVAPDAGFTLRYTTTSGKMNDAIGTIKSGNYYEYGDKKIRIELSSVSGNCSLANTQA